MWYLSAEDGSDLDSDFARDVSLRCLSLAGIAHAIIGCMRELGIDMRLERAGRVG
jgi:hypothetical protein